MIEFFTLAFSVIFHGSFSLTAFLVYDSVVEEKYDPFTVPFILPIYSKPVPI